MLPGAPGGVSVIVDSAALAEAQREFPRVHQDHFFFAPGVGFTGHAGFDGQVAQDETVR